MASTKDLDVRILRQLTSPGSFQWNFRESYTSMAKKLGVDAETVRITLARSLKLGLVKSWRLILNPELLGCRLAGLQLEVADTALKPKAISQIKLVEGVVQLLDFHGLGLRVVVYFQDEPALERKIELIKALCGYNGEVARWISVLPHCAMRLLNVDWKILKAVMHDPRRNASEVAEETGVSNRTINRRLRRMTETNVAYLIPVRNVKMSKGNICSFLIFCSEKGKVSIREFLGSQPLRVDFIHNSAKDVFIVTLVTDNLSDANEMREKLKAIEEVREVRMGVLNDFVFIDDWLDHAVDGQIVN